jgi:hypothetical protein
MCGTRANPLIDEKLFLVIGPSGAARDGLSRRRLFYWSTWIRQLPALQYRAIAQQNCPRAICHNIDSLPLCSSNTMRNAALRKAFMQAD